MHFDARVVYIRIYESQSITILSLSRICIYLHYIKLKLQINNDGEREGDDDKAKTPPFDTIYARACLSIFCFFE